jgi:hypothetical protein
VLEQYCIASGRAFCTGQFQPSATDSRNLGNLGQITSNLNLFCGVTEEFRWNSSGAWSEQDEDSA